ncbi:MAG TPA: hypothetical protein VGV68_14245, partial [Terriglobia bacterium]|nr:hypothetical protein [Terriglobia bacterium]
AEELATRAHDEHDPLLRLWCLGVKGDADDELNVAAARQDWEEALNLAQQLGQREWPNRARGGVW